MDTGTVNLYAAHLESTPYGQVFQKIIHGYTHFYVDSSTAEPEIGRLQLGYIFR